MASQTAGIGKIAIVGGGISGVVLGLALLKRGIDVTIYEQAHHFGEIGAGVAFNPAATRAMEICSPDVYKAFEEVATRNISPEKKQVWFDWLDGQSDTEVGKEKYLFTISNDFGANAVHRAHFLDGLVKYVPEGLTHFAKHLDTIEEQSDGQLKLKFHDGSSAMADAVIGTDGIKSRVRASIIGDDHPGLHPQYTHKYAYRGLIPMSKATAELGADLAQNAKMHTGPDAHVLTFPVNHGETMNVVAFFTSPNDWPSESKLTLPSDKEHVLRDFAHFGATVHKIIDLLEPNLDCWAIFDLGDHPLPRYNKGRMVLLGDAGHATSPHHGAGAGMCIEDAAVMAEILADERVAKNGRKGVQAAFEAYNRQRLERTQWLVQSSRRSGDLYEWRAAGVGKDFGKIENEVRERCEKIWEGQATGYIAEAKKILGQVLG